MKEKKPVTLRRIFDLSKLSKLKKHRRPDPDDIYDQDLYPPEHPFTQNLTTPVTDRPFMDVRFPPDPDLTLIPDPWRFNRAQPTEMLVAKNQKNQVCIMQLYGPHVQEALRHTDLELAQVLDHVLDQRITDHLGLIGIPQGLHLWTGIVFYLSVLQDPNLPPIERFSPLLDGQFHPLETAHYAKLALGHPLFDPDDWL